MTSRQTRPPRGRAGDARTTAPRLLFALSLALAAAAAARGQEDVRSQHDHGTPPQHAAGVSAAGSYVTSDLGTVNLSNGSLNFRIPLGTVGGRGFALPLTLNYSSKVWSSETGTAPDPDPHLTETGSTVQRWPVACAVYDSGAASVDIYQRVAPGWTLGAAPVLAARGVGISPTHNHSTGRTDYLFVVTKLTLVLPDRGEIELRDDLTDGAPLGATVYPPTGARVMDGYRGRLWRATDGSGVVFIADHDNGVSHGRLSGVAVTAEGTRYRFEDRNNSHYGTAGFPGSAELREYARAELVTDRNGNRLSIAYQTSPRLAVVYTDQLGRTTRVEFGAPDPATGETLAVLVTSPGFGGQPRHYKLKTGVMNQNYRAGVSPQLPVYTNSDSAAPHTDLFPTSFVESHDRIDDLPVLTRLVLPDASALRFSYNQFGEVAETTMPTGAKVQYDYSHAPALPAGNSPAFETHPTPTRLPTDVRAIDRAVTTRRIYPDGQTSSPESHWSYEYTATPGLNGAASQGRTEEVARASDNATVLLRRRHHFLPAARFLDERGGTGYALWSTGLERRTETLDASGAQVLAASEQDWSQRAPVAWSGTSYPSEQTSNDNRVNETRSFLDDGKVSKTTTAYDDFNNPTHVYVYDYGQGAPPARAVRHTHTEYVSVNPSNGINYADPSINLRRLQQSQRVYSVNPSDGSEKLVAHTETRYDESQYAPLAYPGVTGWAAPATAARGNPTTARRWLDASNAWVETHAQHDQLGQVRFTWDASGDRSETRYNDSFSDGVNTRNTYAFPTATVSPVPDPSGENGSATALVASAVYDFSTGLPASTTDANSKTTAYEYNDPFNRPTRVVRPSGGGSTTFRYTNTAGNPSGAFSVETFTDLDASRTLYEIRFADSLGRASRVFTHASGALGSGQESFTTVDTQHDALGRVRRASNAYSSSGWSSAVNPSGRWTTSEYDMLGRVVTVTTPDGAAARTTYSGNQTTTTDPEGRARRATTDALGRLTRLVEDPAGLAHATDYTYDAVGNLRKVEQGGQARFFMYDSLGRLVRARQPEQTPHPSLALADPTTGNSQWSLAYSHDADGHLVSRTDARGVTTTYDYDALGRSTRVDYSDTTQNPDIERHYDGASNGRGLPWHDSAYSQGGAEGEHSAVDGYDAMGRALNRRQHFLEGGQWSAAYNVHYVYNLAGGVTSATYPSGRSVAYSYDPAGRLANFTGNLGDSQTRTYSSETKYDEAGRLQQERFGTQTPVYSKSIYNLRGQLSEIRVGTTAYPDTGWNRGAIINHYSNQSWAGSGADNGGNLKKQDVFVPRDEANTAYDVFSQFYDYDSLNRLTAAREQTNGGAVSWRQQYDYDRFGNRTISQSGTWGGVPEMYCTASAATNRLGVPSGYYGSMQYDAAGNLINDTYTGAGARTYDAENRMTSARDYYGQTSRYAYDASGARTRRAAGGEETWQVYGASGELVAEYAAGSAASTPRREYGYRAGELLVTAEPTPAGTESNLALGRAATQSSTLVHATNPNASKATDGNADGSFFNASMAHTASGAGSWWQIDLGAVRQINSVRLWNRTDCCSERLSNFYVLVSDTPFASTDLQATLAQAGVSAYHTAGQAPSSLSRAVGRTGRYVRVQLAGTNYLGLAEVEVFGHALTNLAAGRPSTQSSTLSHATNPVASKAVDSNADGHFPNASVAHTNSEPRAWWQVDLGSVQSVNAVKLWNRTDCCSERLANFYVLVSDAPFASTDLQTTLAQAGVSAYHTAGQAGASATVNVGRTARYVRVQLAATNYLGLAEVEVLGAGGAGGPADVRWLVSDQLGTPRMVLDKSGSLAGVARRDFLPFGEELYAGGRTVGQGYAGDPVRQKFTGYEHDAETNLDYARARYYAQGQGRFTSPDPFLASGRPSTPQSWNRYAYALNNPLRFTDPTGLSETDPNQPTKRPEAPPAPKIDFTRLTLIYPDVPVEQTTDDGGNPFTVYEDVALPVPSDVAAVLSQLHRENFPHYFDAANEALATARFGHEELASSEVGKSKTSGAELSSEVSAQPSVGSSASESATASKSETFATRRQLDANIERQKGLTANSAKAIERLMRLSIPLPNGGKQPMPRQTAERLARVANGVSQKWASSMARAAAATVP
ncbi:MAG TPA: discoidin domain-containing protein [Pyrinomonadaceae bacterium]|nr:discoidin domain-containing protein [Pyrinomonadaceae bacterium]